jgi:hypothetical protein
MQLKKLNCKHKWYVMKKFTIALLLSFFTYSLSAQYVSVEGTDLDWNDPTTWVDELVPNLGPGAPQNLRTVTIPEGSNVTFDGSLICNANLELYVSGYLSIAGLTANSNLMVEVTPSGFFVVKGDIAYRNNTSIIVDGEMQAESIVVSTGGSNNTGCIGGSGSIFSMDGTAPFVPENITIPCAGKDNPFPIIDLFSFELEDDLEDRVELTWETGRDETGAFFTIQRSTDTVKWLPVGTIVEATGTRSMYVFDDLFPVNGFAQYRLRLTDVNGKFSFSEEILDAYWTDKPMEFKVVKNHSFWTINMPKPDSYLIEAYTIHGRRLVSGNVEQSLTMPAPDGAVVVRVTNSSNRSASRVVM